MNALWTLLATLSSAILQQSDSRSVELPVPGLALRSIRDFTISSFQPGQPKDVEH